MRRRSRLSRRRTTRRRRGAGDEEEMRRRGEEQAIDIKSNNPHLAGGEKKNKLWKQQLYGNKKRFVIFLS